MTTIAELKFPAALAQEVAARLIGLLNPFCRAEYLCFAGSLRRRKAEVSDVEICYVSRVGDVRKPGEMFASSGMLADAFLTELLESKLAQRLSEDGKPTWGNLNKLALHRATKLPVDFFREPEPRDWWRTLVIRTGPKDFNLKLIAGAKERGLDLHAYGPSFTFTNLDSRGGDNVVRAESEKHFLELCGFPWLEPEERT